MSEIRNIITYIDQKQWILDEYQLTNESKSVSQEETLQD